MTDPRPAVPLPEEAAPSVACDLLVIGSGAGGLSTAVVAAHLGLKVLLVEKDAQMGGTTAWSGGWMWIPHNPLAVAAGLTEGAQGPLTYLRHELGPQFDEDRLQAYLRQGPEMVAFFGRHTALRFIDGNAIPDFHGRSPGAATGGRSVCAAPFDGRRLGAHIHQLKPPLYETTLWGMGIASGGELRHFLHATRRPASAFYVARRLLAHGADLARYRRGMRLVNGNALVAALWRSALDAGVQWQVNTPARRLLVEQGRVVGAVIDTEQGIRLVRARCGVVLASGGFAHDPARKQALLPHAPSGREHWSAASRGNTGDGLRMAEQVGAQVDTGLAQAAALAPVSRVPRGDGTWAHFPHLIERAKPGLIAVTGAGRRFVNEADSYHDFMQALLHACGQGADGEPVRAWLVCDHAFIRRYGLGAVKPAPLPLRPWLRRGYLKRGRTLEALALACGVDATVLRGTVSRYNQQAREGRDTDFAKGETPYNRVQGDPGCGWPNPCMAPLERGPFYAVEVVPGSLGTFAGLKVNAHAQVLGADGTPIAGLYAAGNDMASVMGGHYPSGGITLGPAMTFGYIAAHHAAGATSTPGPG